jgi:hypothetical protein
MQKYLRLALFSWFCLLHGLLFANQPVKIVFTQAEWLSPNLLRIPFEFSGNLITVSARADSVTGNFFFDTGASALILNGRLFKPGLRSQSLSGGVSGAVEILGATKIDTFLLDNLLIVNAKADVVDLRHLERSKQRVVCGIIGYQIFEGYEVLFDYAEQTLLLVRLDANGERLEKIPTWEYLPTDSSDIRVRGHVALIPISFDGSKKWFGFDSGAEQNMLDNGTGARFLKKHFTVTRRINLKGVDKENMEVFAGVLSNARMDSLEFAPMSTLLTNMDQLNLVYGTNQDGIIGHPFIVQRILSINYRKKRLIFYKPAPRP